MRHRILAIAASALLANLSLPALASDDDATEAAPTLPAVAIIVEPTQEAMGGPLYLAGLPGSSRFSEILKAFPFTEIAGLGALIESSSALNYYSGEKHRVARGAQTAVEEFDFQDTVWAGVESLDNGAEWRSISQIRYDFDTAGGPGPKQLAERVFEQSDAEYTLLLRFAYFMSTGLDQLRLHVEVIAYKQDYTSEYDLKSIMRIIDRRYEYLSYSRGELFRPWRTGEKEALIEKIEAQYADKLARYPHNKKAYAKDRKTALKVLDGRETILPEIAISEGWPGETFDIELQAASDALFGVLRDDLRSLAPRAESDSEAATFLALNLKGEAEEYAGQFLQAAGEHDVYMTEDGDMIFMLPRH